MPSLSGEKEMTFDHAVVKAKAGARITRPGRSAWLEFDAGADCLTLHNGQAYRVRWTASPEDKQALDWELTLLQDPMIASIERRLDALERLTNPFGSHPETPLAWQRDLERAIAAVDRTARTLTDGSPVSDDHAEINPATGQQKAYVVLSAEERAKGFVQPVRRSYEHGACRTVTTMGMALAETYARDPWFYDGTFCATCRCHFPLKEFVWEGTMQSLDPGLANLVRSGK